MTQNIVKPRNDNCNYYTFQLNNKLNVFIVEDSETDFGAVSMLVKVGYEKDTISGIAHFLEHMLFNGTEKYPEEKYFMDYISKKNGESNAFTAHDHTCYYYTIQPDCLLESLDIFGNFFISPLLNKDCVSREKDAVNSEHQKNILSDSWRLQEIIKNAFVDSHPIKKFGTGSAKTLDVENIDLIVRSFYESNYSSDLMTLFVITKNNYEQVKTLIVDVFSKVKLVSKHDNILYNKIFDCPKIIKVNPIKKMEKISISWDIESFHCVPLQSPINFLSHLLGHEGLNTIHNLLTNNGLVTRLISGKNIQSNGKCIFSIDMMLTPLGYDNIQNIVYTIMKYIDIIKNKINDSILESLYNEKITLDAFNFKYMKKSCPENKLMGFCELVNDFKFDLKDILMIPYASENFVPNVKNNLLSVLNTMTLSNAVVMLVSEKFNNLTMSDPDYGTKYELLNEQIQLDNVNIDISKLDLPPINNYVSIEDEICELQTSGTSTPIINKMGGTLYWLPTTIFKTPDVVVTARIDLPLANLDKMTHIKSVMYFSSILGEINPEKYMCEMAGYHVNIFLDTGKLYVSVSGNHGKIKNVCDFLISALLGKKFGEKIFNITKYNIQMNDSNCIYNSPYSRLPDIFQKQICPKFYNNLDRLSVIDTITQDDVKQFIVELIEISSVTVLVTGNCNYESAVEICKSFNNLSPKIIYSPNFLLHELCNSIMEKDKILINISENKLEKNSAMGFYVYVSKFGRDKNLFERCCLNIVDKLISTEYFNALRTVEKFGYVVNSSIQTYGDHKCPFKYYVFTVQTHKTVEETINRTKQFIDDFSKILENITNNEIYELINSLISELEAPFNNIDEMTSFIFAYEIETEYLSFNFRNDMINMYKTIKKKNILNFYYDKFIDRKSLIIGLKCQI